MQAGMRLRSDGRDRRGQQGTLLLPLITSSEMGAGPLWWTPHTGYFVSKCDFSAWNLTVNVLLLSFPLQAHLKPSLTPRMMARLGLLPLPCEFPRPLQAAWAPKEMEGSGEGLQGGQSRKCGSDSPCHRAEPAHRPGGLEGVFGEPTASPQQRELCSDFVDHPMVSFKTGFWWVKCKWIRNTWVGFPSKCNGVWTQLRESRVGERRGAWGKKDMSFFLLSCLIKQVFFSFNICHQCPGAPCPPPSPPPQLQGWEAGVCAACAQWWTRGQPCRRQTQKDLDAPSLPPGGRPGWLAEAAGRLFSGDCVSQLILDFWGGWPQVGGQSQEVCKALIG